MQLNAGQLHPAWWTRVCGEGALKTVVHSNGRPSREPPITISEQRKKNPAASHVPRCEQGDIRLNLWRGHQVCSRERLTSKI
eukprot:1142083-Pelagomonas_calceolata.AAC.4